MYIYIAGVDFILVVSEDVDLQETSNVFIKQMSKVDIGARIARALRFIEVANVMSSSTTIYCACSFDILISFAC